MKALSLFTGAGGLDLGLEASGFSISLAAEIDEDARATLARNSPTWKLLPERDVLTVDADTIAAAAGVERRELALVNGGPPCQPFSNSGRWVNGTTQRMRDPRSATLRKFFEVVEATLPAAVLLENVDALVSPSNPETLKLITRWLREINRRSRTSYELQVLRVDAANHGVAQHRRRVLLVAHRDGARLEQLVPRYGASGMPRIRNAWDALGGLGPPDEPNLETRGLWADVLPTIPEGENYLWHTSKGGGEALFGYRTRYWSFLLKLAKAKPSWTLQADPGPATGPFHWDNRRLSVAEMLRLQSFPSSFRVSGSRRSQVRQVGNAVPPALGEAIGAAMALAWFATDVHPGRFDIAERGDLPPAASVRALPARYRSAIGQSKAHPGVGLGPGASLRSSHGGGENTQPSRGGPPDSSPRP